MKIILAVLVTLTLLAGCVIWTVNPVRIDSVATMTYGLEGGGMHMLNWHERHRAQSVRSIDKSAMRLRPVKLVK